MPLPEPRYPAGNIELDVELPTSKEQGISNSHMWNSINNQWVILQLFIPGWYSFIKSKNALSPTLQIFSAKSIYRCLYFSMKVQKSRNFLGTDKLFTVDIQNLLSSFSLLLIAPTTYPSWAVGPWYIHFLKNISTPGVISEGWKSLIFRNIMITQPDLKRHRKRYSFEWSMRKF